MRSLASTGVGSLKVRCSDLPSCAIYAGHPVLLLDESTGSLDEGTERDVLTNIKSMTDCTVVLVTHGKAPLGICDLKIDTGETLQDREG